VRCCNGDEVFCDVGTDTEVRPTMIMITTT
jgi:hypothetical protein